MKAIVSWIVIAGVGSVSGLRYDGDHIDHNLNQNETAVSPLDYWGKWPDHEFHPSPENWRFPFYTLFLDRFVNGDVTNDDINGTVFEHDIMSNQLRHGGDVAGLVDSLDYLQGMGIKGIYIAGSPFINAPWGADSYSPLDMTLLDKHFATITQWRAAIDEIHRRGMYVLFDNTMATMGDLIGFKGYLNDTTPFTLEEHEVQWKSNRHYLDFEWSNDYNETCEYPRFWLETGFLVGSDVTDRMNGCYDSEFDQYGDTEAFGVFPDWQRQLSKFASVQDRLREWRPTVLDKIKHFSCITINMLDIDGYRIDKALQVTVDAQAEWSEHMRECARAVGKENFFIPGEITGGNTLGSIYLGRGRQPDMLPENITQAVTLTNDSDPGYFVRDHGKSALDSGAFHYSIYRSLTRFLGLDGNLAAGYDIPVHWVNGFNNMLLTNDFINANTGKFDPRHMYGATNQDVFRWPTIRNGTERMLLAMFVTTIHLPGIPLLLWGEEQAFYVLDNTADNYIFGRQAMSPALAWQNHGCYSLGSKQYFQWPIESGLDGCNDDSVSLDHRDPAHPIRNIVKAMYHMREQYPVLNDGAFLQLLSNQTRDIQYPGSNGTVTETGLFSVLRSQYPDVQDLSEEGERGNQSVWLLYHNDNATVNYEFDCSDNETALIAPFDEGTTVKNLFYPHEEITLKASTKKLGIDGSAEFNGCLDNLTMAMYEYKAYVPKDVFIGPPPMITKFVPGHDARVLSTVAPGKQEEVDVEFHFSAEMDCESVTNSLIINSTTEDLRIARLVEDSVECSVVDTEIDNTYVGGIPTTWKWKGRLENVSNGVHALTIDNATTFDDNPVPTNAKDRFLFRIGQPDNPMVFAREANYTRALLHKHEGNDTLFVSHKAAGADKWRYSLNWGSSWSEWADYHGGNDTLENQEWSGTSRQRWDHEHIVLQYYTKAGGSADVMQHGDLDRDNDPPRRFPHLFAHGPFNQYGFDAGLRNEFHLEENGRWEYHFMGEWPAEFQVNVWGMNPDGQPDQTGVFGDVDGDGVLDKLPPSSLAQLLVNLSDVPPAPYLAWRMSLNDGNYRYDLIPVGNRWQQLVLYVLLWIVPVLTGGLAVWLYTQSFYAVKFNEVGVTEKKSLIPDTIRKAGKTLFEKRRSGETISLVRTPANNSAVDLPQSSAGLGKRRCVLIATMEYDIEDWGIKIKIGGLGVMAQLMGKNLGHQDLIWVVPCVGGIDYPVDRPAESMRVKVLGKAYEVQVQYHTLRNITYVLLDAPIFRKQTKSEPYPARMDDLESAIYYSAWNSCIAEAIKRFPVDLYHINDYHGAVAPLHLLPETVPCCLSLHNAEFQGLWPMRTDKEQKEVSEVFDLDLETVREYVQFGSVFNLLHAGASYLRVHQKGFGAVGVSNKYGKRSFARYPIFWGLSKVGKLPNPDPSDTAEWDGKLPNEKDIKVDPVFEAGRPELRKQAQEWAGLNQDPDAELFVFVGRWSMQKGIDLIADVFPPILEQNPKVQLICIGPVIDLYGKFAALKLGKMMEKYPGRVYSKPEFTALPPFIFSGAEFALIPSRDEPFGLVAVEFGRKGALGVGCRVGGLGHCPGWWATVESTSTTHMLQQFKQAIEEAIASDQPTRALMRARAAKQRFPVAQWVESLEALQSSAIKIHEKERKSKGRPTSSWSRKSLELPWHEVPDDIAVPPVPGSLDTPNGPSAYNSPTATGYNTPNGSRSRAQSMSRRSDDANGLNLSPSPEGNSPPRESRQSLTQEEPSSSGLKRTLSLGYKAGPGHDVAENGRRRLRKRNPSSVIGVAISEAETEDDQAVDAPREDLEYTLTREEAEAGRRNNGLLPSFPLASAQPGTPRAVSIPTTPNPTTPAQGPGDSLLAPPSAPFMHVSFNQSRNSVLSLDSVTGGKTDFKLQKVDPFFTDSTGEFYSDFGKKLDDLNGKTSESHLCIEEFLVKSERLWFDRFRDARLGRTQPSTPATSIYRGKKGASTTIEPMTASEPDEDFDEFLLGKDYKPPNGLKKYLQIKVGDWPLYSFFLAFGQIVSANSYQITLLTGEVGQTAEKLYVIASIYLGTSIIWWFLFRRLKSVYVLSLPFLFYGLAFFFIGLAPFAGTNLSKVWVQNVATGLYATASSSGSIFFAMNFGDEGGAPVKDWVYRASTIQGTQQIYVVALWYWGSTLAAATASGRKPQTGIASQPVMAAIAIPIAVLFWAVGTIVFAGLPDFYRQRPGKVPSFYKSLARRKIILWFFATVILQNYFLSAPYGRNWQYLWSSNNAPAWAIALLVFTFFIGVWGLFLWIFSILSKDHSWILPIFAIGLGAPRWCQMLWGTSSIGMYIPWASGHVGSALAGRSLWLWLGVLDTVQGVGLGMILLQTLTRIHVAFTLIAAQVLGSVATILARATAPNKLGPGDVFPDFSEGAIAGLSKFWFWIALAFQLVICVGFFKFFRKEQLAKP
ncbi:hypothetical protein BDY21DRAFT_214196 [Lineolata rhizophorae]|uniref:alpha-1,3-glucan synthase n=1 Tax=Lineolata rhizophorae TaxID=578093 RepID=A0A6A6P2B2_9PEZI|nr:hypothetical protein BDY21DRAFT_214196 [Lineolata rhizophorae]